MSENTQAPDSPAEGNPAQTLVTSFVRLSTAITVFGLQQVQTAVESRDPQTSFRQLHQLVDSLADALSSHLDESRQATVRNVSGMGADVVGKTLQSFNPANLNPQDLMQTTGEIIKRTSASLSSLVNPAPAARNPGPGEPVAAGDALSS